MVSIVLIGADTTSTIGAKNSAPPMRKLRKAFKAYRAEYGFPEEPALLNKLLESDDEDLLIETMETVERLFDAGELKAGSALKARIKSAMILVDAPEVQNLGNSLLKKLR